MLIGTWPIQLWFSFYWNAKSDTKLKIRWNKNKQGNIVTRKIHTHISVHTITFNVCIPHEICLYIQISMSFYVHCVSILCLWSDRTNYVTKTDEIKSEDLHFALNRIPNFPHDASVVVRCVTFITCWFSMTESRSFSLAYTEQ